MMIDEISLLLGLVLGVGGTVLFIVWFKIFIIQMTRSVARQVEKDLELKKNVTEEKPLT